MRRENSISAHFCLPRSAAAAMDLLDLDACLGEKDSLWGSRSPSQGRGAALTRKRRQRERGREREREGEREQQRVLLPFNSSNAVSALLRPTDRLRFAENPLMQSASPAAALSLEQRILLRADAARRAEERRLDFEGEARTAALAAASAFARLPCPQTCSHRVEEPGRCSACVLPFVPAAVVASLSPRRTTLLHHTSCLQSSPPLLSSPATGLPLDLCPTVLHVAVAQTHTQRPPCLSPTHHPSPPPRRP